MFIVHTSGEGKDAEKGLLPHILQSIYLHHMNPFALGRKLNNSGFLDSSAAQKYLLWGILAGSMIIYRAITSSLEYTWNKTSVSVLLLKEVPLSIHALHIQYSKQVRRLRRIFSWWPFIWGSVKSREISTWLCFRAHSHHCYSTFVASQKRTSQIEANTSPIWFWGRWESQHNQQNSFAPKSIQYVLPWP